MAIDRSPSTDRSARPRDASAAPGIAAAGASPSPSLAVFSSPRAKKRALTEPKSPSSFKDDTVSDNRSAIAVMVVQNQISLSSSLLGILLLVHFLFPYQHITSKFLLLSHKVQSSGLYVKGPDDAYFVFTYIAVFTLLRAVAMDYVFLPFARVYGISDSGRRLRFAEQAWLCTYDSFFASLGIYIMYHSPYWSNTDELWAGWPHRELTALFKWYYLVQLAFWLQQLYTINIEKRRKDHYQMLTHHIVTSALLIASYNHCFTRAGNAILCLMDVVDIGLAAAKLLKYLGFQRLCDVMFGIFLISWIYCRHVLYNKIVLSAMFDAHRLIEYKCFFSPLTDVISVGAPALQTNKTDSSLDASGEQCFSELVQYAFVALLLALQVMAIIWLYMIVRVAIKVVTGVGADDTRSDDEDDEDERETELEDDEDLNEDEKD
ncbi:TLC domain-containing protein [Limtongia smithiae]|uniref:TLC domain-containing protein n=1 Tax=Limtongia smithiae TaxID=1125753 RepID=UPI0034CEBADE